MSGLCGEAADEGIPRNGYPLEPPQGRDHWPHASATETKNWHRIGTGKTVFVLISFGGATNSPQRSFPGVSYLVQNVRHARGLR